MVVGHRLFLDPGRTPTLNKGKHENSDCESDAESPTKAYKHTFTRVASGVVWKNMRLACIILSRSLL